MVNSIKNNFMQHIKTLEKEKLKTYHIMFDIDFHSVYRTGILKSTP